uniref:Uncharacterized protein n=1 Tax=Oncorhynchus kisutch TaxID=8019 RepID=A0A8C7LC18_ONCKI
IPSILHLFLRFITCLLEQDAVVKIEVLHKPFACFQKSKYGDILLVHFEGFLESNGTMFHSR